MKDGIATKSTKLRVDVENAKQCTDFVMFAAILRAESTRRTPAGSLSQRRPNL